MPSPKPGNPSKVCSNNQQGESRLTRRSFCSSESIHDLDNIPEIDKPNNTNNNNIKSAVNENTDQQLNCNNNDNPKSWWKRKYNEYNPSLTLENKASVARDHLANERTFLAWLRTSLSFISIGIAVTQLFRLSNLSGQDGRTNKYEKGGKQLGIVFIILGIIFLSFGIMRYFHSQHLMTKGYFPASRGSIVIGTILTIVVLAACFIIIIF